MGRAVGDVEFVSVAEVVDRGRGQAMSETDLPKIGAPATRALAAHGTTRLEQIADRSEAELLALHGFGPKALRIIKEALAARGQSMRP